MYLIPRNISKRFEFFPGWGWKELLVTMVAIGVAAVFIFVMGFITSNPVRYFIGLFIVFIGYLATRPVLPDGSTAMDMFKYMNRFWRAQNLYLYRKEGI